MSRGDGRETGREIKPRRPPPLGIQRKPNPKSAERETIDELHRKVDILREQIRSLGEEPDA